MGLDVIFQAVLLIGGSLGVLLGIVFVLGLFVQTVTEFLFSKIEGILVTIFPALAVPFSKTPFRAGLISLVTVGLGVWAAFLYQLDLVYLVGSLLSAMTGVEPPIDITLFGKLITAIVIGMGASYIHDLIIKPLLNHFTPQTGDGPQHDS